MQKLRWLTLSGFVLLAAMSFFTTRSAAEPGQVKLVVQGVWFREGDIENLGHCNNTIIEMKDYLIVVDANFPSGARLVMETVKRISPKPVKYVFDTHHHGDHAYANALWTKEGATTLAFPGVADEMKRLEPGRWREASKERKDVADMHQAGPEPPQQLIDKSPLVLKDGTREVRFYHFGWGHTRGDGFVYLPQDKLLITGDTVVNGPHNWTADANLGNWPKVIRQAQLLNPVHVLPGHGPSGGPELLEGQVRFLNDLRRAVDNAIKSGKKFEEVLPEPGKTTITLPKDDKNWVGNGLATQVKDTWEEIVQKKPHGDIVQ
ncbi:MAG: MBL fold metallo-hydrolase [Candidatus Solibacter sp.]